MKEIFEIVDENDNIIGKAPRSECHGNPDLIHRTAHVIVLDDKERVLLQKRSMNKDIQPGKWDTAVGGHLDIGENYEQAGRREMNEEIGIPSCKELTFLFDMRIRNKIESENVKVFSILYTGPFKIQEEEVDKIKFWTKNELMSMIGKDFLTPNCEIEIEKYFEES